MSIELSLNMASSSLSSSAPSAPVATPAVVTPNESKAAKRKKRKAKARNAKGEEGTNKGQLDSVVPSPTPTSSQSSAMWPSLQIKHPELKIRV